MKRALLFIAILGTLLSFGAASAQDFAGTVTADQGLRVRQVPGLNAPVVGAFDFNQTVTISGREDQEGNGGIWVFATNGTTTGWILSDYLAYSFNLNDLQVLDPNILAGQSAAPEAAPADQNTGEEPASSAPPAPPVAGSANLSGFNFGAHISGLERTDLMQAIGMSWVKIQVRHGGGTDGGGLAGEIANTQAQGFNILLGVVGDPNRASDPAYQDEYAAFVGSLAANGANAIEVWNEPNINREWASGQISPESYTNLLAKSYNAIKSANPSTIVISAAPAPTGFFGNCTPDGCDDAPYLARMVAAGANSYMDCVGAHYNEGIISPTLSSGDPRGSFYTRYYSGMVNRYASITGKPICFTELGYLTGDGYGPLPGGFAWASDVTIAQHAQWLADAITLASRDSRVRMLIVWNWNFRGFGEDPQGGYAMLRPDGSCPACDAILSR